MPCKGTGKRGVGDRGIGGKGERGKEGEQGRGRRGQGTGETGDRKEETRDEGKQGTGKQGTGGRGRGIENREQRGMHFPTTHTFNFWYSSCPLDPPPINLHLWYYCRLSQSPFRNLLTRWSLFWRIRQRLEASLMFTISQAWYNG